MGILDIVPAGVVTGDNLLKVFEYGKCFSRVTFTRFFLFN